MAAKQFIRSCLRLIDSSIFIKEIEIKACI